MSEMLFEPPIHDPFSRSDVHAVRDTLPSQAYNTFIRRPPAARLEIDDLAYHEGSALTLPMMPPLTETELEPWSYLDEEWDAALKKSSPEYYEALQKDVGEREEDYSPSLSRSTLVLAAVVLAAAGANSSLRLVVAGHADANEDDADALSEARAKNFLSIVAGDRDTFIGTTKQYHSPLDIGTVGYFLASTFGWPWPPAAGTDAKLAASLLRTSYNAAAKQEKAAPFFAKPLPVDSDDFTDADFGAVYDCYQFALAAILGVTTPDALGELRAKLQYANSGAPSAGYGASVDLDKHVTWRSRARRRVEVLFVDQKNAGAIQKRGVGRVYDPDLFAFAHFTPNWIEPKVWLASEDKPAIGDDEDAGSIEVDVNIRKKPEGLDYFDDLLEHPPAWPGQNHDDDQGEDKWEPSESD
jgi:hypothetical protein